MNLSFHLHYVFILHISGILNILCFQFLETEAISSYIGVKASLIHEYHTAKKTGKFTCLNDSSLTVPYSFINDNYCDCIDGSDEPSTSACTNGIFWCKSKGFKAQNEISVYISKKLREARRTVPIWAPSYLVNDGIQDCCDGSDEVSSGTNNLQRCERLDSQYQELLIEEIQRQKQGALIRKEWMKVAKKGVPEMLEKKKQNIRTQFNQELRNFEMMKYSNVPEEEYNKKYNQLLILDKELKQWEHLRPNHLGTYKEYYPLLGKCFRMVSNEKEFKTGSFDAVAGDFEFELCPFLNITQRKVISHEEYGQKTVLGMWNKWEIDRKTREVDSSPPNVMGFANGDECWEGPSRTVRVIVECGTTSALIGVKENGKCLYEMVLMTPAACSIDYADILVESLKDTAPPSNQGKSQENVKDEL